MTLDIDLDLEARKHSFNLWHTLCWKDNGRRKMGYYFSLPGLLEYQPPYPLSAQNWTSTAGKDLRVKVKRYITPAYSLFFMQGERNEVKGHREEGGGEGTKRKKM